MNVSRRQLLEAACSAPLFARLGRRWSAPGVGDLVICAEDPVAGSVALLEYPVLRGSGLQRGVFVVGRELPTLEVFTGMLDALTLPRAVAALTRGVNLADLRLGGLPVMRAAVTMARGHGYRSWCDDSPITRLASRRTRIVLTQVRARVGVLLAEAVIGDASSGIVAT